MDVSRYLPHFLALQEEEQEADRQRAADVRRRLPALVRTLVHDLGAKRVVLFGSLLDGELTERSDVDIAVEGVQRARYWEALWRCSEAVGRSVDLIPLEEASASLRARIEEEGEVLHD